MIKAWLSRLHSPSCDQSPEVHAPLFYNNSVMFSIKRWVIKLVVEVVATCVLHEIRVYVPEFFVTLPENQWKFTDCLKKMCQFMWKKTLIYVLSNLASIIRKRIVREVFINMPYYFRRKKMFSKHTAVVVV